MTRALAILTILLAGASAFAQNNQPKKGGPVTVQDLRRLIEDSRQKTDPLILTEMVVDPQRPLVIEDSRLKSMPLFLKETVVSPLGVSGPNNLSTDANFHVIEFVSAEIAPDLASLQQFKLAMREQSVATHLAEGNLAAALAEQENLVGLCKALLERVRGLKGKNQKSNVTLDHAEERLADAHILCGLISKTILARREFGRMEADVRAGVRGAGDLTKARAKVVQAERRLVEHTGRPINAQVLRSMP
jgi:hypothetical protein